MHDFFKGPKILSESKSLGDANAIGAPHLCRFTAPTVDAFICTRPRWKKAPGEAA